MLFKKIGIVMILKLSPTLSTRALSPHAFQLQFGIWYFRAFYFANFWIFSIFCYGIVGDNQLIGRNRLDQIDFPRCPYLGFSVQWINEFYRISLINRVLVELMGLWRTRDKLSPLPWQKVYSCPKNC